MSNKEESIEEVSSDALENENGAEEKEVKETKKTSRLKRKKRNADKEKVQELEEEVAELKNKYLRLFAEFDNYKKRTVREKLDLMKTAAKDTLSGMLDVLDDFDRAKITAEDENTDEVFSDGVQMVYNKLNTKLSGLGLKAMESTNEDFDPELHAAITEIPAPEGMKGKVIDTIEKGYYLNDTIIRHAKVVVGK